MSTYSLYFESIKEFFFHSKFDFPLSDWLRGQLLPYHGGSTKLKPSFLWHWNEMQEIKLVPCLAAASCMLCCSEYLRIYIFDSLGSCILSFMLPANSLLLFCQKYGLQAYIMSALLWSCIWNWYVQSLIFAVCAVLVLRHRNRIGDSTSLFRNHNLESFRILAW